MFLMSPPPRFWAITSLFLPRFPTDGHNEPTRH